MSENTQQQKLRETSSSLLNLQRSLSSCSRVSIESGDQISVSELVESLGSLSDADLSDDPLAAEDARNDAFRALSEILSFLSSPSLDEAVADALSFELPKAAAKFAGISDECLVIVHEIIDIFVAKCSPRDMLPVLCEALGLASEAKNPTSYAAPLFTGLAKVIPRIQRRHFEQVKVALPIILHVLKVHSSELNEDDPGCAKLFERALSIGDSIKATCQKLDGKVEENLRSLLGLYVLQVMALLSLCIGSQIMFCVPLVSTLSSLLHYCGCSYDGLITESDIAEISKVVAEEEEDYLKSCFSDIRLGASLVVIWGHISEEVAQAASENMPALKDELKSNQTKRWLALSLLKHILSSVCLPWELKEHAIDFLLCITDNISQKINDEKFEYSIYVPGFCAALQGIANVIMYAPTKALRKKAFEALKTVAADTPAALRVDIFHVLIKNYQSSTMTALLLDLLRGELHKKTTQSLARKEDGVSQEIEVGSAASLWTTGILDLVEIVLRPPVGGLPSFPEHTDAVLAALNFYRYILMTESARNTNYTGVISKKNLQKARSEWLLPLRTAVTGIIAESRNERDPDSIETVCSINPVELVLYRCIELVEEKLKQST